MKKTVFVGHRFAPALLLVGLISSASVAQKPMSPSLKADQSATSEVNVTIIERDGDQTRKVERTYRTNGLTKPDRDQLVTKLVDSLKATRKASGRHQMTIIVEDNNGDQIITRERVSPNQKRVPADAYALRDRLSKTSPNLRNNQNWHQEFRWRADSIADRIRQFNIQLPRDFDRQLARPFEDWARNVNGKPSTIRGLDAYPNNPDREQLNIRFTAPTKGDVTIVVANARGKEIARREIKDFAGEYVGQIDLGKKAQGAYFLTVTQQEDGAVKRVIVD